MAIATRIEDRKHRPQHLDRGVVRRARGRRVALLAEAPHHVEHQHQHEGRDGEDDDVDVVVEPVDVVRRPASRPPESRSAWARAGRSPPAPAPAPAVPGAQTARRRALASIPPLRLRSIIRLAPSSWRLPASHRAGTAPATHPALPSGHLTQLAPPSPPHRRRLAAEFFAQEPLAVSPSTTADGDSRAARCGISTREVACGAAERGQTPCARAAIAMQRCSEGSDPNGSSDQAQFGRNRGPDRSFAAIAALRAPATRARPARSGCARQRYRALLVIRSTSPAVFAATPAGAARSRALAWSLALALPAPAPSRRRRRKAAPSRPSTATGRWCASRPRPAPRTRSARWCRASPRRTATTSASPSISRGSPTASACCACLRRSACCCRRASASRSTTRTWATRRSCAATPLPATRRSWSSIR